MSRLRTGLLLIAFSLTGCAVGPNYQRPPATVPAAWGQGSQPGVTVKSPDLATWWHRFDDPLLDALIDRAVAGNLDLRVAGARVREARAMRGVAAGDRWPTVSATGRYSRIREPGAVRPLPPGFDPEQNFFEVGLDAIWKLDIWGRVRRGIEAAEATLEAAEDNRRDVLVILLAEVARNLVEVRAAQQRLVIARSNIQAQQDIVELTRVRSEAGLGSEVEVSQARTLLATTEAQVPALETARDQGIHRVAVLVGAPSGGLLAELRGAAGMPSGPPSVPVGPASDRSGGGRTSGGRSGSWRPRPPRSASRLRISSPVSRWSARWESPRSTRPRFSPGAAGSRRSDQVVWPIFAGGRIRANIRVQEARQEAALARYEQRSSLRSRRRRTRSSPSGRSRRDGRAWPRP